MVYLGMDVHRKGLRWRCWTNEVSRCSIGTPERSWRAVSAVDVAGRRRVGPVRGCVRMGLACRSPRELEIDTHLAHAKNVKAITSARLKK